MRAHVLLLTALLALAALSPLRADVLVVDQADPFAWPEVDEAVAAALPGDIVLVRPGDYTTFLETVIDKSLTIVGEVGPPAVGPFRIENLGVDDRVVLSQLDITGSPAFSDAVSIFATQGVVLVENCTLMGVQGAFYGLARGLSVVWASAVLVTGSTVIGADGGLCLAGPLGGTNQFASDGVRVRYSTVAFYHSALTGGCGCSSAKPGLAEGGYGLRIDGESSDVRVFGTTITGGDSGSCTGFACTTTAQSGGDGLLVEDGAIVRAVDSTWVGGAGIPLQSGGTTLPGDDVVLLDGAVLLDWDDVVPEVVGPAVLREGEEGTLTFRGEPGELLRMYLAFDVQFVPLAGKKGVFVPDGPTIGPVPIAVLPASGEFEMRIIGPYLLGLESALSTWQVYTRVPGSTELVMSNPYELLLLEEGL